MTRTQIVCYRMEELLTLYYGNFAILGERVRDFAWCTSCSNCIADRTQRSQIFLDKLKREHPGWTTTHRQEWGLFLLEHLLHNTDSMKKKEHQRCSQRPQPSRAEEERVPRAQRPLADPGLLGSVKRRSHSAGYCTSAVHHMGQNPSRHILQSSPRAPQVPGSGCGREWLG